MSPTPSSLEFSMASEVLGHDLLFESTDASIINAVDTDDDDDSEEEWEEVKIQTLTPAPPTHDVHRTTPTVEPTLHSTAADGEDEDDDNLLELELELEQALAEIGAATSSLEADESSDNEAPSHSQSLAELTPSSPPKPTSSTDRPTVEPTLRPTAEVGEDDDDDDLLELELQQALADIGAATSSPEADQSSDNEAPSHSHSLAELTPPSPPKFTSTTDKNKVQSTPNVNEEKASTPSSTAESCRVKRARKNKEKKPSLLPSTPQPKPDAVAPSGAASSTRIVKENEMASSSTASTRPKTPRTRNQVLGKRKDLASTDITFTKETVGQLVHHAVLLTFERGRDVPPVDDRVTWGKLLYDASWRLYTQKMKECQKSWHATVAAENYTKSDLTVLLDDPSLGLNQETIDLCVQKMRAQGVAPTPPNSAGRLPPTTPSILPPKPSKNLTRDTGSASISRSTSQSSSLSGSVHRDTTQRMPVQGMDRNFSFDMRDQQSRMLPDQLAHRRPEPYPHPIPGRVEGPPYPTRHVPPPPPRPQLWFPPQVAQGTSAPVPPLGYGGAIIARNTFHNERALVPPAHASNHAMSYQQPRMIPMDSSMTDSTRRSPHTAQFTPLPLLQQHAGNPGAGQAGNYQQPRHIGPNLVPYSPAQLPHNQGGRHLPSTASQYPRSSRVRPSNRTSASGITSQAGPSTRPRRSLPPPVAPQEPQSSDTVTGSQSGNEPMLIQFKLDSREMREEKRRKY